jgi:uncharacterized protein (TIGR03083 family)
VPASSATVAVLATFGRWVCDPDGCEVPVLGSSLDASSIADADQRELTLAVARAGERLVALARRVTDPTAQVPNSEWTVRELLAHVAAGADAYARYLEGDATAAVDVSHIAGGSLKATNAALIAAEPEQAPSMLSDRIERRLAAYLRLAAERSLDERVAWHGRQERLGAVMAVLLGELLVHGLDLARATSAPWPLSKRDAAIGLRHASELFPLLLDRRATGALTATVDVRLRQGPTLVVAFRTGELSVGTGPVARADVHVSADPVAFLLVAYGRMSQWRAIATGRLLAWGRRPCLALRLTPVPGPAVTLHRLDGGRCRSAAGPARHRRS